LGIAGNRRSTPKAIEVRLAELTLINLKSDVEYEETAPLHKSVYKLEN
jgi:hypothetical protein